MSVSVLCDVCYGSHSVAHEQLGSVVQCRYCRASFTADESVQLEVPKSGMTLSELTDYGLAISKKIGSMVLSVGTVVLMLFLCTISPRSTAESVIASSPARNNSSRTYTRRPATQAQQMPAGRQYRPPAMPAQPNGPDHSDWQARRAQQEALIQRVRQQAAAPLPSPPDFPSHSPGMPGHLPFSHDATTRSPNSSNPLQINDGQPRHPGNIHPPFTPPQFHQPQFHQPQFPQPQYPRPPLHQPQPQQPQTSPPAIRF